MEKVLLVSFLVISSALLCTATTYTVGDNSGWDISSDLDSWAKDRKFAVGDVLVFQYSSSDSVSEVTRQSYDSCNTTNVLNTYTSGNTSVTLKTPGDKYFISGNRLYCLGGMKLHVSVEGKQAYTPAGAPPAQPGATFPNQPSSKNNNPAAVVPASAALIHVGRESFVLIFMGILATLLWIVQI